MGTAVFAKMMHARTAAIFALRAPNVRMENAWSQQSVARRSPVVPAKIVLMGNVWTETVELAAIVMN